MNIKSREDAFHYVMSEMWTEFMHIHDSKDASISITICRPVGAFTLEIRHRDEAGNHHVTNDVVSLTELVDTNYSMTSWLRTNINQSGAVGPVRQNQPK